MKPWTEEKEWKKNRTWTISFFSLKYSLGSIFVPQICILLHMLIKKVNESKQKDKMGDILNFRDEK